MISCSGGTCRDARWAGSGSPRKRRCSNGSSSPPCRARLPRRRRPWRTRLPTAIPLRWWTPCTRGKRGSAPKSSTPRGQAVSSAGTRLEVLSLRYPPTSLGMLQRSWRKAIPEDRRRFLRASVVGQARLPTKTCMLPPFGVVGWRSLRPCLPQPAGMSCPGFVAIFI
jgi:hypothetical protein